MWLWLFGRWAWEDQRRRAWKETPTCISSSSSHSAGSPAVHCARGLRRTTLPSVLWRMTQHFFLMTCDHLGASTWLMRAVWDPQF